MCPVSFDANSISQFVSLDKNAGQAMLWYANVAFVLPREIFCLQLVVWSQKTSSRHSWALQTNVVNISDCCWFFQVVYLSDIFRVFQVEVYFCLYFPIISDIFPNIYCKFLSRSLAIYALKQYFQHFSKHLPSRIEQNDKRNQVEQAPKSRFSFKPADWICMVVLLNLSKLDCLVSMWSLDQTWQIDIKDFT